MYSIGGINMAVTIVNGQATSSINIYGTTTTNKVISSATPTAISSSITVTNKVASTTSYTTPSTTQKVNSSSTSKVSYTATSISSSTMVSNAVSSSTTVSNAVSSSTTVSNAVSSSTTVSNAISSSTTVSNAVSSSTMYVSSSTPIHNMISSSTTVSGMNYMDDKEGTIAYMVDTYTDNYEQDHTNYVDVGATYKLGEYTFQGIGASLTFSSEIMFHTNPEEASLELSLDMETAFKELSKMVDEEEFPSVTDMVFDLFGGAQASLESDGTTHIKIGNGEYEYDLNMSSLLAGKFEFTISKSTEIDNSAILTNSVTIEKYFSGEPFPEPITPTEPELSFVESVAKAFGDAWDTASDGAKQVVNWIGDHSEEIVTVAGTTSLLTAAGIAIYMTGGAATPAVASMLGSVVIQ